MQRDYEIGGRGVNLVLGAWLFISAFLWFHGAPQFTNTWVVGLITAGVALAGFWMPEIRWINAVAGAWLIISVFALYTPKPGTFWNNLLVGIVILLASLVGSGPPERATINR